MSSSPEFDGKKDKDPGTRAPDADALEPGTRSWAEGALGEDLGRIRIHRDAGTQAGESDGARAATRRQDIYFARGEYDTSTREGKQLLVHELTHAIQQRKSGTETADRQALEAEADQAAEAASRGVPSEVRLRAPAGLVQKEEKDKPAAPVRHPFDITATPPFGTFSAGPLSIPYIFTTVRGAAWVPLRLRVPDGVSVTATALTEMTEGRDFRVLDAAGTRARTVVIEVASTAKGPVPPRLQVIFTRGSSSYVVAFQFPASAAQDSGS